MNKEEILNYFKENDLYTDEVDARIVSELTDDKLTFLYKTTIKYRKFPFSQIMELREKDADFLKIEKYVSEYHSARTKRENTIFLNAKPVQTLHPKYNPKPISKKQESDNTWLVNLLKDLCDILEIPHVHERPNDLAEFIMPTVDIPDTSKICLYDYIEYLTSGARAGFLIGVAYNMVYCVEKSGINKSNKFKALARFESQLFNFNIDDFMYYLEYSKYEMDKDGKYVNASIPDTLFNRKFNDIINNPEDPVNAYLIGMLKNKTILDVKDPILGISVNVHGEDTKKELK